MLIIQMLNNVPEIECNSSYIYNGVHVPRVTEMLSKCIHSDVLMYWANSLGFKHRSYKKTLDLASSIGTECHDNIDIFLSNDYTNDHKFMYDAANFAYDSYLLWWNNINETCIVEILMHEQSLICKYFGGTLDGLYKINGKIYLVDYKTSNQITFKYALQTAAYRYILKTELDIDVDGIVILQLSKNDIAFNEYLLDLSDPVALDYIDHCQETFLSIVYAYYNIKKAEADFKKLDWGV